MWHKFIIMQSHFDLKNIEFMFRLNDDDDTSSNIFS